MNIQVLVAAMHQKDHSLLEKMHIKTDAIVAKGELDQSASVNSSSRILNQEEIDALGRA